MSLSDRGLFLPGRKYSSGFLSLTTIYKIMAVLIRRKIWGGGFQFIWFHSWNRIMNRLFASLPLPNRDGETKGKMMATKKAGQTKLFNDQIILCPLFYHGEFSIVCPLFWLCKQKHASTTKKEPKFQQLIKVNWNYKNSNSLSGIHILQKRNEL